MAYDGGKSPKMAETGLDLMKPAKSWVEKTVYAIASRKTTETLK